MSWNLHNHINQGRDFVQTYLEFQLVADPWRYSLIITFLMYAMYFLFFVYFYYCAIVN